MTNSSCGCKFNCLTVGVIGALIAGIITAFLRITAVITVSNTFVGILFGIAVVFTALIFAVAVLDNGLMCRCSSAVNALLVGISGMLIFSLILLSYSFAATSVSGAVFSGLLLFFLFLTVASVACFVRCTAECDNNDC